MENHKDAVFNAILGRRSIRRFDDSRNVEKDKITKLLNAGMAAPSACNIQPWDFIIITNGQTIGSIKESIEKYGDYNAVVIIVVCGNNEFIPWKDHGIIDCAAAMENIMLAAPSLGLGTVCIGGFNREKVKELLEIPQEIEPVGMIYLGYPAEGKKARTKYIEEAVHWEKYDTKREHRPRPGNIIEFGMESSL
jgi:nitroreductase